MGGIQQYSSMQMSTWGIEMKLKQILKTIILFTLLFALRAQAVGSIYGGTNTDVMAHPDYFTRLIDDLRIITRKSNFNEKSNGDKKFGLWGWSVSPEVISALLRDGLIPASDAEYVEFDSELNRLVKRYLALFLATN